jgi:hypothetical protein
MEHLIGAIRNGMVVAACRRRTKGFHEHDLGRDDGR